MLCSNCEFRRKCDIKNAAELIEPDLLSSKLNSTLYLELKCKRKDDENESIRTHG